MLKLLDLFCGAGGCSMGYHRAGFEVVGVDIKPQPHYPFEFIQADALSLGLEFLQQFDAIHASPPCQAYTEAALSQRNAGKVYPDLMAPTRCLMQSTEVPFVIENTPGAPMRVDIVLCGSMFGLRLIRHRWFECNFPCFFLSSPCAHHHNPVVVTGHGTPTWSRKKNGGKCYRIEEVREAMGIDWMNRDELSQAIPPAYTEFIGRELIKYLEAP